MKSEHRRLLSGFSALFSLEMANKLLPLVTLPYLVRVLGIETYGLYAFSLAIMAFLQVFISFGFDLYATRLISVNRLDKGLVQNLINGVFGIKLFLMLIGLLFLLAASNLFHHLKSFQMIHLVNYISVFGTSLFAIYYFQGNENMKIVTFLNVLAKIIFTALVLFLIKSESDVLLLAWINGLSYFLPGCAALYIIYCRDGFRLRWVGWAFLGKCMRESAPYFYSRLAVSIYSSSTVLVVGMVLGNSAAGIFSIAEKLFKAISSLYGIFNQLLYPYIAYKKDLVLYKKLFLFLAVLNTFAATMLYVLSPWLLPWLFGVDASQSVDIMRLLSVALCFMLPAVMLGYPLLGALGYSGLVNRSVIYGALLHLVLLGLFYSSMSLIHFAILILFTESMVFLLRVFFVIKTGVLNYK